MILSRRRFICGIAPAIIAPGVLMAIKPSLAAVGTITFGVSPSPGDTVTLNGKTFEFVGRQIIDVPRVSRVFYDLRSIRDRNVLMRLTDYAGVSVVTLREIPIRVAS